MADFDLAVIGGGINGAGIARDAAGRGLRVLLVEQGDFASGTSSASTKLIHGGLRYLEHGAFRLVREALSEREILLRVAPHVVRPMRFVLPLHKGGRARWLLRAGLFLYDHLGSHKILPPTATRDLARDAAGLPLAERNGFAFEYSDCWVDDARLVILNAIDACERGAAVRPQTRCVSAARGGDGWSLTLESGGRRETATARILVNATGAWIGPFAETVLQLKTKAPVRLVKGSHIVVRKLFDHDRGYLLQNADGRVVFALPYEQDFTLIGTTDQDYHDDPARVMPSAEEIAYLCRAVNDYFREPIAPQSVVWSYAGVRSLYDDGSGKPEDATRDYHLTLDDAEGAPLLTVYGGKITTHRKLAEAALVLLDGHIGEHAGKRKTWTAAAPLPGGDFAFDGIDGLIARTRQRWPFLDSGEAVRLVRAYGTRVERVLGEAKTAGDLGARFGDLTAAEVRYLMMQEWARTADDVLWRRSKLGLHLSPAQKEALSDFMASDG